MKLQGGKGDNLPKSQIRPKELAMGEEVEKEHKPEDTELTEDIAKDHLAEIPDYYTRLKKMEAEAKNEMAQRGTKISCEKIASLFAESHYK